MFKVVFEEVELFNSTNDIEAVQFALAIHQSSNVAHTIKVLKTHDPLLTGLPEEVFCTLFKASK